MQYIDNNESSLKSDFYIFWVYLLNNNDKTKKGLSFIISPRSSREIGFTALSHGVNY
jgi:hypothetical protein